jgi:hypothetical protein
MFFLSGFLSVPIAIQDMIMEIVTTTTTGYTILLHLRLYTIFPVLIIIPTLFIAVIVHFLIQAARAKKKVEEQKLLATIKAKDTVIVDKSVEVAVEEQPRFHRNRRESIKGGLEIAIKVRQHVAAQSWSEEDEEGKDLFDCLSEDSDQSDEDRNFLHLPAARRAVHRDSEEDEASLSLSSQQSSSVDGRNMFVMPDNVSSSQELSSDSNLEGEQQSEESLSHHLTTESELSLERDGKSGSESRSHYNLLSFLGSSRRGLLDYSRHSVGSMTHSALSTDHLDDSKAEESDAVIDQLRPSIEASELTLEELNHPFYDHDQAPQEPQEKHYDASLSDTALSHEDYKHLVIDVDHYCVTKEDDSTNKHHDDMSLEGSDEDLDERLNESSSLTKVWS